MLGKGAGRTFSRGWVFGAESLPYKLCNGGSRLHMLLWEYVLDPISRGSTSISHRGCP